MSDYYQQQVTLYMIRRTKRRAGDASTDGNHIAPAEGSANRGWLARLGTLFLRRRKQSPVAQPMPRPSGEIETA